MCGCCDDHAPSLPSRRKLMAGAAALVAASALPFSGARAEPSDTQAPRPNAISPADALERLRNGNERYAANEPKERDFSASRAALAEGQFPIAGVLACSEGRVVPDLIFDQSPGSLFVVRVAGNVVDSDGIASFEYAVKFLGVPLLMVLGHANCGVVGEALGLTRLRKELPGRLGELVKAIGPAVITAHGRHSSDFLLAAVEENVRLGVKRLISESEIISEALAAKTVAISGGVYDIASGKVKLI